MTSIDDTAINPPNPFSAPIASLLSNRISASALNETAARLVTSVAISPTPTDALWQLWDAFFTAVTTAPHDALALLTTLRNQPPSKPKYRPTALSSYLGPDNQLHWHELPGFSAQWSDTHAILESQRGRPVSTLGGSGAERFLQFCIFSAALLKTQGGAQVHPIWVFYACRNVLERGPTPAQLQPGRISSEQMWELDVRVAATWVRDAGRVLWGVESGELQPWEAALREKTELWPRGDGLTRERWVFWGERLRWLGAGMGETRVVDEAATVVDGILELNLV